MFWKFDEEENEVVQKKSDLSTEEDRLRFYGINPNVVEESDEQILSGTSDDYLKETEEEFMSSDETGSEKRFDDRVVVFKKEGKPVYKHHGWWFVHNCIAHFFIGVFPCKKTFEFHDWTSKKINGK